MAKKRSRWQKVTIKGFEYIQVLIWFAQSEKEKKNRNAKREFLKRPDGSKKPFLEFAKKPAPDYHWRSDEETANLIEEAVDEVYKKYGLDPKKESVLGNAPIVLKGLTLSMVYKTFRSHIETKAAKKTGNARSKSTLREYDYGFENFTRVFGEVLVDQIPDHIQEDYAGAALLLQKSNGETYSPRTIRKFCVSMNTFFSWGNKRGMIPGKLISLDLPEVKRKIPRTFTEEALDSMERYLEAKIQEWSQKTSRKDARTSKAKLWRIRYRAFMLARYTGMRVAEIWSLRLHRIKVDQGPAKSCIELREINDIYGGSDKLGKEFRISFKTKSNQEENVNIGPKLFEFLKADKKSRRKNERWYLDRGDGSNWFVTANSLGDSFNKVVKECGFAGMAKRAHGFRSSLATKLTQESGIHVAFKQLRHASIETTIKAYVGDSTEAIQAALGKVENASQINDAKSVRLSDNLSENDANDAKTRGRAIS